MTTSAPAPAPTVETPHKPKRQAISKANMKLSETCNNSWRIVADKGTAREELRQPDLYAVVADLLHAFDRISVVAADRSYYAEMLVLDAGRGWAQVMELAFHQLPSLLTIGDGLPPGFDIEYKGPDSLYVCTRICDGVVIGSGFPDRQSCLAHLLDHASLR